MKRKKGQVLNIIAFGLAVVFVAISFIFLSFFITNFSDQMQSSTSFNMSTQQKDYLSTTSTKMPGILDAGFAFLIIGSGIALIISSAFIRTSMVFFFITLPIFIVAILGNLIFANLIDDFGSTTALASTYVSFPIMAFFVNHWLETIIVIGFMSIVAFFGGKEIGGGGA